MAVRDELCRMVHLLCPNLKHILGGPNEEDAEEKNPDDSCLPCVAFEAICDTSAWGLETFARAQVSASLHTGKEDLVDVARMFGTFKVLYTMRWNAHAVRFCKGLNGTGEGGMGLGGILGTLVDFEYFTRYHAPSDKG